MRAWLRPALPAWVATRLGLAGMSVFASVFAQYMGRRATTPLKVWFQWDTGWYLAISQLGYYSRESANFFPLYPSLVALGTALLGHERRPSDDSVRLVVALAITSVFALVALAAAASLAAAAATEVGERTAMALAAFPTAFFLTAAYTEAPFVAFSTVSLLMARRRRWALAAACAVLAGLTRSTAVVLVLPLAWEALRGRRAAARFALGAGMAAAPLIGIGIYAAYLGYRFGDPLLFAHTQAADWHHQLMAPWQIAALVADHLIHHRSGLLPLELLIWLGALVVLLAGLRRLPLSYTLLAAGVMAFAVAAPTTNVNDVLASTGRYLLAATPLFVVVAGWMRTNRYFEAAYLVCALLLQGGLLLTFLLGGPVM
jgi:hypothetical protein